MARRSLRFPLPSARCCELRGCRPSGSDNNGRLEGGKRGLGGCRRVLLDPRRRRRTGASWVRFAITSRHGGHSEPPFDALNLGGRLDDRAAVEANRTAVAAAFDLPRERLLFMDQCHSADVAHADGPWPAPAPRVDALVSTRDDLALAALVRRLRTGPARRPGRRRRRGRPRGPARDGCPGRRPRGRRPRSTPAPTRTRRSPSSARRCAAGATRCRKVCATEAAAVSPPSATVSWTGTPAIDVAAGVVDQLSARGDRGSPGSPAAPARARTSTRTVATAPPAGSRRSSGCCPEDGS